MVDEFLMFFSIRMLAESMRLKRRNIVVKMRSRQGRHVIEMKHQMFGRYIALSGIASSLTDDCVPTRREITNRIPPRNDSIGHNN
jgi:hypothetical protein